MPQKGTLYSFLLLALGIFGAGCRTSPPPPPPDLVPVLLERSGNMYTVGVNLEGTTEAYRGVQFTVELPLAFNLSASVGSLTPGCNLDYAQVSLNPNRWNIALVCTGAFNGPGELARLFVTGTGGGTLALTNAMLARPDYTEETVPGGSLVLGP